MKLDNKCNNVVRPNIITWSMMLLLTWNITMMWPMVEGDRVNCTILLESVLTCWRYILDLNSQPSQVCCNNILEFLQLLANNLSEVEQERICEWIQMAQEYVGVPNGIDTQLTRRCGLIGYSIPVITSSTNCSSF